MALLAPVLKQKFFSASGLPLAGGKLYTYQAGTTTPLATYTDYGGASANANPVVLDANGEADIWLGSQAYKFILKDSADVTQWTVDNVNQSTFENRSSANLIENLGVTCSVSSNALTINLTDSNGNTPSSQSPVKVGFRSSTISSGLTSTVSVESATSIVVTSGATLGHSNNVAKYIYVYLVNNGGVAELAVSSKALVERTSVSTTAMSSAADSASVVYSTTARTSVSIRLIARLTSTQTTAGTWAALPTEVQTGYDAARYLRVKYQMYANSGSVSNGSVIPYTNAYEAGDDYSMSQGSGAFALPWNGTARLTCGATMASFLPGAQFTAILHVYKNAALYKTIQSAIVYPNGTTSYPFGYGSCDIEGLTTDIWDVRVTGGFGSRSMYANADAISYNYLDVTVDT